MMSSLTRALKGFLMLGLFLASFTARGQDQNADIYGKWKITEFTDAADIVSMSDKEARALIGKPLIIKAERFQFNGKKCLYPHYQRSTAETVSHFRKEWQADSSDLRLPNPVTVIDNECYTLYPQRKDHLIIAGLTACFFLPFASVNNTLAGITEQRCSLRPQFFVFLFHNH